MLLITLKDQLNENKCTLAGFGCNVLGQREGGWRGEGGGVERKKKPRQKESSRKLHNQVPF